MSQTDGHAELETLETRLAWARAAMSERERLSRRLERSRRHLATLHARIARFQAREDRERRDVDDYSGLGLSAWIEQCFGDLAARQAKELREWLTSRLRLEQARAELAATQADVGSLERRLATDADPQEEYQTLLQAKHQLLEHHPVDDRVRRLHQAELEGQLRDALRELDEAEWAGQVAKAALTGLLHCLSKAQALGRLDMFGLASSWGKFSHIDDAQRHASAANRALSRFQMELADVHARHEARLEMQIGHLATFADAFLDDLVSDWVVQCRIDRSHTSAGIARTRVSRALRQLLQRRVLVRLELQQLAAGRGSHPPGQGGSSGADPAVGG